MVLFTLVGFLQVFFRLVLRNPLSWSEEACRYLFIWSTLMGAVLVSAEDGHFKVDMLVSMMPKGLQTVLRYISYGLIAVFSLVLIKYGYVLMMSNTTRISPAMGIKVMYIYSIFVINGGLVLLHLVEAIWNGFKERKEGVNK